MRSRLSFLAKQWRQETVSTGRLEGVEATIRQARDARLETEAEQVHDGEDDVGDTAAIDVQCRKVRAALVAVDGSTGPWVPNSPLRAEFASDGFARLAPSWLNAWSLPPHPGRDVLLFLADGIGVDRRRAELGVPHPLLKHVQRDAVHRGVDSEAVAQALRAAVRGIRHPRLDHDPFDDLPDPHATERPDRRGRQFAGFLGFPDAVGGVERVQVVRRRRNAPVDDLRSARGILAFLQAADGDRTARQVHPGRGDLQQLRRAAAGEEKRLAERAVAGGLPSGHGQEGGALFGVEVEPVSGGVVEAHFAHV